MLSVLLSFLVLAVMGSIVPMIGLLSEGTSYGSKLEEYIISRNPKDTADVERYTRDFDSKKNFL